jgi:RES domain-containing protein
MRSVFRLTKRGLLDHALSGVGAAEFGGRWNSPGARMVYTSATRALAALECLVHFTIEEIPDDYVAAEVVIPNDVDVAVVAPEELPRAWDRVDQAPEASRKFGDEWVAAQKEAVLGVPSVVARGEWNYLINPLHPQAARLSIKNIESFQFDPRLKR